MSPEMNPIEDDGSGGDSGSEYARLDATLRRFLSTELDGQLGRARTAFEAHVARPAATHRPRRATRSRLWVIGLAGAGAVAVTTDANPGSPPREAPV
jgi:hypothetical protein